MRIGRAPNLRLMLDANKEIKAALDKKQEVRALLESKPDLNRSQLQELVFSNAHLKDLYDSRPELKELLQTRAQARFRIRLFVLSTPDALRRLHRSYDLPDAALPLLNRRRLRAPLPQACRFAALHQMFEEEQKSLDDLKPEAFVAGIKRWFENGARTPNFDATLSNRAQAQEEFQFRFEKSHGCIVPRNRPDPSACTVHAYA